LDVYTYLRRLQPRVTGEFPPGAACFTGGAYVAPHEGFEVAVVEMRPEKNSGPSLALDIILRADREGVYNPDRFGGMTREYQIFGVPGGERIAVISDGIAREQGYEYLASAGGTRDGRGFELRASLQRLGRTASDQPWDAEMALFVWHTMLHTLRPNQ
jgi:hypothetical protein